MLLQRRLLLSLGLLVLLAGLLVSEPSLAGPGGKIASALFDTLWGKILLALLVVVFLPLYVMVTLRERAAERRALADLAYVAQFSSLFDWPRLRKRALSCFHRVHAAWRHEDTREAAAYMTDWYWQNQQLAYLDQWAERGLVNHCQVKKVSSVRPLLLIHRNEDNIPHQSSQLVVAITATLQDYLADRETGRVVEGSKKFKEVETLWSLLLEDGCWRVCDIEDGNLSLSYIDQLKQIPPIEETVMLDEMPRF